MARILAYWDIRGLGQSIRLLLNYVGEEFEDKFFVQAEDFTKASWVDVKYKLGFDFPNLPYYIDGDLKLTQSNAILRYIGRKHKLCGKTDEEQARVDMMLDVAMDFRNNMIFLVYQPKNDPEYYANYMKNLEQTLSNFDEYMNGKSWFVGDQVTIPDFHMYELLDQHRLIAAGCLDRYTNLNAFLHRFEALPPIKKYMSSEKFMKWPLNNKHACLGSYKHKPAEK